MIPNNSPWIKQLNRTRPVIPLQENLKTDVVVVGGGIAGVVTAYFTLRDTDKNVILLEADKIAHGATGHNAGQITSHFERPLHDLVEEFGLGKAIEGQRAVESAWLLIDEIYNEANLQTPLYRFTGYTGCTSEEQVLSRFKNHSLRLLGGLGTGSIFISRESGLVDRIPNEYKGLYEIVSHADLLNILETNNPDYIAASSHEKGCMNSALFTEELIGYLIVKHKGRFNFFEESPAKQIILRENSGTLSVLDHTIETSKIVLCTNGFTNFSVKNETGTEIDAKFHHLIYGRIGYMTGYTEPMNRPPITISYFPKVRQHPDDPTGEGYFYLTRRPHEHKKADSDNLICTGGPEKVLPNHASYSRIEACGEEIQQIVDDFLRLNYKNYPKNGIEHSFCWHGLMGYTPNGIRRIGPEPCNPVLMYNLGCNGVGILPSIYGGKRISEFLAGKELPQTIFDPLDQRCEVQPAEGLLEPAPLM